MNKKHFLSLALIVGLLIVLMGCTQKTTTTTTTAAATTTVTTTATTTGLAPDVTSVEITNTTTTLEPGTYTITTQALPAGSVQTTQLTLVGNPTGVSLTGTTLTIASTAVDKSAFTIRVTSMYDPSITATKDFTVSNPNSAAIEITTQAQLQAIGANAVSLSKSYILMNNIVLTGTFTPLGTPDVANADGTTTTGVYFTGMFNGNGYTISGLNIDDTSATGYNLGLFAQIGTTGIVKDFTLEGSVNGAGWCGSVAGINGGTIENVASHVNVTVSGTSAGGLVSVNNGTIKDSYADGIIVSGIANTQARSAGLVVANNGQLDNIYGNYETMTTQNFISFDLEKNPTYMLSTADMEKASTFSSWDTSIWWLKDGFEPMLKNAGFVPPTTPTPFISITNTDSTIDVTQLTDMTYQINTSILNNNNYTVNYSLAQAVAGVSIDSTTGLITFTSSVANQATITVDVSLAQDSSITASKTFTIANNPVPTGNIVQITTEQELINLATTTDDTALSKTYILMNDIKLSQPFTSPIGTQAHPFTGTFNGQGHTISGFTNTSMPTNFGLFGYIGTSGVVENLGITGLGTSAVDLYVGGGSAVVANENDGLIQNVFTDVSVQCTGQWASGFVDVNNGTIKDSYSLSKVTKNDSPSTPGIGFVIDNEGTITDSYLDETVSGAATFLGSGASAYDTDMLTTAQMQTASTFSNWSSTYWNIADGAYPALIPFVQISTEQDLTTLASSTDDTVLSLNYVLVNDIALTQPFTTPIGTQDHPFTGTFNGNGHIISGFTNTNTPYNFGLFGYIGKSGVVENFGLTGLGGSGVDLYIGAGSAVLANENDGLIQNVYTNVSILCTGNWDAGFVDVNNGTIKDSYSLSKVMRNDDKTDLGIGFAIQNNGTITSSFVDETVTGAITFISGASALDANLLTTAQMQTASTYAGWDTTVWNIQDGAYPTFK